MPRPTALRGAALILVLALSLTACTDAPDPTGAAPGSSAPAPAVAPDPAVTPDPDPVVAAPESLIARADTVLDVFSRPDVDAPVLTRLPATTGFGSPRALLVLDRRPGWVRVDLPIRPNGSSGWVPATAVDLEAGRHRVVVDLAARHLLVLEDGEVVIRTPVAVGAPDTPTPTGTFALVDRLQAPDPEGPYGPFALGLSGHSATLSEFAGGNGQVGIHGTDDPASIGQDVSHGCVRVPNDVVARLAGLLPLGTPVTIR